MTEDWLGLAFGIGPVAVLLSLPFWGSLSDVTGRSDRVVQLTAVLAGLTGLGLFFTRGLLAIFLLVPVFYSFEYAIEPMVNAAVLEEGDGEDEQGQFGKHRLWGSLGFVIGAGLGGIITDTFGWLCLFLSFLAVMVLLAIRVGRIGAFRSPSLPVDQFLNSLTGVVGSPRLQGLLVFLVLWSIPFSGNFMAFSWYWEQVGGSASGLGVAWGLAAVLEIPLYWLSVRYWDTLWLEGLLIVSPLVAALRWLLYLLFPYPGVLYGVQLLHGLMFVSFSVGSVYLVDVIAKTSVRNTGQGILGASVFGLGAALGNLLAGVLFGRYGATVYYTTMIAVDFLAVLVMILLVLAGPTRKETKDRV